MSRNFPGDITEKETGVPDSGHILGEIRVSSTAWLEQKAYGEEPMTLGEGIQETLRGGGGLWTDFHFVKSSIATVYRTHFGELKFEMRKQVGSLLPLFQAIAENTLNLVTDYMDGDEGRMRAIKMMS